MPRDAARRFIELFLGCMRRRALLRMRGSWHACSTAAPRVLAPVSNLFLTRAVYSVAVFYLFVYIRTRGKCTARRKRDVVVLHRCVERCFVLTIHQSPESFVNHQSWWSLNLAMFAVPIQFPSQKSAADWLMDRRLRVHCFRAWITGDSRDRRVSVVERIYVNGSW